MTVHHEIMTEIERRVAQRRDEGKYPVGLEEQFEAEFQAIFEVVHRGADSLGLIEQLLAASVQNKEAFDSLIRPQSHFPFGSLIHRIVNRATGRRSRLINTYLQKSLDIQTQMLEQVHEVLRQQRDADARVLNQLATSMRDRLLMVDVLAEAVLELENRSR